MGLKVGDKVKANCYPGPVVGRVTKIVGRCIFIDSYDNAGRALCVDIKSVTKLPGSGSVTPAPTVH